MFISEIKDTTPRSSPVLQNYPEKRRTPSLMNRDSVREDRSDFWWRPEGVGKRGGSRFIGNISRRHNIRRDNTKQV